MTFVGKTMTQRLNVYDKDLNGILAFKRLFKINILAFNVYFQIFIFKR